MPKKDNQKTVDNLFTSLSAVRILLGLTFLWAFFDKLLGLGFATPQDRAWINGGSPTLGFLKGVEGPFESIFHALAGLVVVDWLFMIGLLGIGVGLVFGVAMKLSTISGGLMLFLMWLASMPIANNPLIDDHLIYMVTMIVLYYSSQNQAWSLKRKWNDLEVVKDYSWLE